MKAETKGAVLIIDDDVSILRTFTRVLERKGFSVATARTGREAWEKLKSKSYDAALIDVRLPDMEGTDLLRRMSALVPRMAKIVFTGSPLMEREFETAKTGADAFLLKPVNPELLLTILEEKLTVKRASATSRRRTK